MKANRYVGIDIEGQYIETARRRFADGEFLAVDARKFSFPPLASTQRCSLACWIIWTTGWRRIVLRERDGSVKPTGEIVIAEPVFTPGMWISNALLSLDRGRHIRSEAGIARCLATAASSGSDFSASRPIVSARSCCGRSSVAPTKAR